MQKLSISSPFLFITIITVLTFAAACSKKSDPATKPLPTLPDQVTFAQEGLYPESVEFDSEKGKFLVTSLKRGSVGIVDESGHYTSFIEDETLVSAIGIRIDQQRNRLFVCNSDPGVSVKTSKATQKKLAGLAVYELSSGKQIKYLRLDELKAGSHFCNDIALAEDGSVFVTDSFNQVIYRVDPEYKASVFLDSERMKGQDFNLNGIVVHPDGYLLVAKSNDGILFKVPLNDPTSFTEVTLDTKMQGADGLILDGKNHLVVIAHSKIFSLESNDNWQSASVKNRNESIEGFATTGIQLADAFYVLHAKLDLLFSGQPPAKDFSISRIRFE